MARMLLAINAPLPQNHLRLRAGEAGDSSLGCSPRLASQQIPALSPAGTHGRFGKPDRQGRRVAALQVRVQSLEAELALKDGQLADLRAQVLRQSDLLQSHRQEGAGELPLRLIKVIEKERVVSERMLFVLLGIGQDDAERREALGRQLEELEGLGTIKKGSNGWRWVK